MLQVPNMSPSAASASSDLYCAAVDETCRQLRDRLQPFRKDKSWEEAVKAAYGARTDLSAHGFHATPDITGGLLELRSTRGHWAEQAGCCGVPACCCVCCCSGSMPSADLAAVCRHSWQDALQILHVRPCPCFDLQLCICAVFHRWDMCSSSATGMQCSLQPAC